MGKLVDLIVGPGYFRRVQSTGQEPIRNEARQQKTAQHNVS